MTAQARHPLAQGSQSPANLCTPPPTAGNGRVKITAPPRPAALSRAGLFPWVPVGLAVGIAFWFSLPADPARWVWLGVGLAASVAMCLCLRVSRWAESNRLSWSGAELIRLLASFVILIAIGFSAIGLRSAWVAAPVLNWRYYGAIEGLVVQIDRSARDRIRLTLDQPKLEDVRPEATPRRVRISLMDAAAATLPEIGQRVSLIGHLGPPPGPASPDSFDFRWHAWFNEIGAVGYARKPVAFLGPAKGGHWRMHRARLAISKQIQDRIGGQEGAVASALMTGDRSGILEATNKIMRASNLYHIISISGLHMGMLAGFVYAATRFALIGLQLAGLLLRSQLHKLAALTAILAATIYLWLSGGGVATERAYIMVCVMLIAILSDRRAISLRTVSLAATAILLLNPEALVTPGFQMSFAATVALILVYSPWSVLAPRLPRLIRPVCMLITSSLIAGLATAPIAAAHFNQMAQYGLLANLMTVPIVGTFVMPAGVVAAVLAPVGLEGPALWVMGLGTAWMLWIAQWVAGLGGAVTPILQPPPAVIAMLAFGAVIVVLCWRGRKAQLAPRLHSLGKVTGLCLVLCGFAIWLTAERPQLLISDSGDAVGLMTPVGRAMSKPSGGSFVTRTWLRQDGDRATQPISAERAAWTGHKTIRVARLPGDWELWHLTGKGSGAQAAAECLPRRIVVTNEKTGLKTDQQQCLLFDLFTLRRTGAVAIKFIEGAPRVTTVKAENRAPGHARPSRSSKSQVQ